MAITLSSHLKYIFPFSSKAKQNFYSDSGIIDKILSWKPNKEYCPGFIDPSFK